MIENLKNIFTKLNRLNNNIIFFYYHKYISDENFTSGYTKIDLQDFYDTKGAITRDCRYEIVKLELPYYYKMLNLYAHMVSIIEDNYGTMNTIYNTVQDNFIINLDDPQDTIEQILFDMTDDTFSDLSDVVLQEKNKELKILMQNANRLNTNLKKYGTNEGEFRKNSNLDDYKYISYVGEDNNVNPELEQRIIDLQQQIEIQEYEAKISCQMAQQQVLQGAQNVIPVTSLPEPDAVENELKYLSNLNDMGLLSNKEYHKRVTAALLKHNQTRFIKPVAQKPPIINNTKLYDKLMKMNPMVNDDLVKELLELNKDEKE